MRALLAGSLLALPLLAHEAALAESFEASVRRLCTGTRQQDCWVKAGAALCPTTGGSPCTDLDDHTPARAIRKEGRRWLVETARGTGWVQERAMVVDTAR